MSALGGILNFGGSPAPVDRHTLIELGERLETRGPDGGGEAILAHVGMTYRAFHTTYESQFEEQPLISAHGHMLTWDGRLDNRDELIRELFCGGREGNTVTDLEIVFAAYLRWGQASFVRLIGDCCLALWDPQIRQLFLVRDVLGTRPLHYWVGHDRIVWSTELLPLLDVAHIAREVNEDYVAGFLVRYPDPGITPFKNVFTVKPHHVLQVKQDGQLQETRYWGLDPGRELRYKTDEDYEQHFIHEFCAGLKARLRSHRTVFAEASGGLDSSSIICMSDRLIKNRKAHVQFKTISYLYDESPTADESGYIGCLEKHIGRRGHHLKESEHPVLAHVDRSQAFLPNGVEGFAA